jgi:H+/gluconate symporter-like permease
MPFFLIFIGLLLTVVSVRNNQDALYAQLGKDFTGQKSFTNWLVAVVIVGSIGYFKPLRPLINPFLGLMIIAFFISNAGGFANLLPALQQAFDNIQTGLGGSTLSTPPVTGGNENSSGALPAFDGTGTRTSSGYYEDVTGSHPIEIPYGL